ncbi:chitinase [Epithele typhae]|uniref:chitinase n=1 Tax=Epithele typhae TaxID=378194 RepID=UPI002008BB93|nr:chitinase [Epithele typhae]KAH9940359.1 chitinase [Epithele typhae]
MRPFDPLLLFSLPALVLAARSRTCKPTKSNGSSLVSAAWYAGWHSDDFPLSSVSWDKYTHMTYSFAETTEDVSTLSLNGSNPDLLPVFVQTAHENNVKALVSIGGWTGSRFYSSAVADSANRTAFVDTVVQFATQYGLDGLDFDWEYPGNQGIGCNTISANDTTNTSGIDICSGQVNPCNFLTFLQLLRQDPVGRDLILTSATSIFPWIGPTGDRLTDVSGFADVLDWIAIMNYDLWGSWSASVGPNSPLNDTCASSANQQGSAVSGVAAWADAGMPAQQIVLGVASYGHSFSVTPTDAITSDGQIKAYPAFNAAAQPHGDAWDDDASTDVCGVTSGPGGNFDFWGLIDAGFLLANGTVAPGIDYRFDSCSQTAYVYNETSSVMVSFDDARAFAAKGAFIKSNGLRGFATWEAGGDSKDILLDAIRSGAGAV